MTRSIFIQTGITLLRSQFERKTNPTLHHRDSAASDKDRPKSEKFNNGHLCCHKRRSPGSSNHDRPCPGQQQSRLDPKTKPTASLSGTGTAQPENVSKSRRWVFWSRIDRNDGKPPLQPKQLPGTKRHSTAFPKKNYQLLLGNR